MLIGASECHVAGGFLGDTILTLTQRHPRMAIRVIEANTAALAFQELRNREVDLMLGRIGGEPLSEDLHADHFFNESLHVVAGGQNDWVQRDDIDFADLADKPWILSPPENAVHSLVAAAFRDRACRCRL